MSNDYPPTITFLSKMLETARKMTPVCSVWTHRKTGNKYKIINLVVRESDLQILINYCRVEDAMGVIWSRPISEFMDGRFIAE